MIKHSSSSSMGKIWVEVSLISARGLPCSSFLKLQWYAVGWIDPKNKYCTKIDASGNPNPVWKTKFTTVIDASKSDYRDLALHVEVYSREPLFPREKLQGTATIILREFLANHSYSYDGSGQGIEDVGSFQLRKKNCDKPQGYIDVSISISEEKEGRSSYSYLGNEEDFNLRDGTNGINLMKDDGTVQLQAYPPRKPEMMPLQLPGNPRYPVNHPCSHRIQHPSNDSNLPVARPSFPPTTKTGYPPPRPPPPPPPSHVGYIPTFLPRTNNQPTSYMNVPSSEARRGGGPGFGGVLGAGALAAGAVIFGDDFLSGFEVPAGIQDASLTISTDPLSDNKERDFL